MSLVLGCGGGSSSSSIGGPQTPGLVGPAGGTVSSADGLVVLTIPPTAVSTETQFTIETASGASPSARIVGAVYDIEPSGTTFAAGALPILTMPYPAGVIPSTLTIGTLANGQWVDVAGSHVDQANHTVTAPLEHLSPYAVLQPAPEPPVTDNHAPVITTVAIPATGTTGQQISFSASASDADGNPLTYTWTFGDGSQPQANSSGLVSHTYGAVGTYSVSLTVTDPAGLSDAANGTISISQAQATNHPPAITSVVMPTPSTVIAGQPVTVSATATDEDHDALTYSWTFGDQTPSTPANPSPVATHTYGAAGSYVIAVTASDGQTTSPPGTATLVVIAPPNRAPIANPGGPYTGIVNQPVLFDASASIDPDGTALTYQWNFGDGSPLGSGVLATHTYTTTVGSPFTVTVTATDPGGLSSVASTTATITPPANQPPIARAGGPYSGTVGQVITFDASSSTDPEGGPLTYTWNFGDGTGVSGAQPTHAYGTSTGSPFTVTLTVRDAGGLSNVATTTATITPVANRPPVASAGGPYVGAVGEVLTLSAAGSTDPDGDSLTYTWNFGDGTAPVMGLSVTHAYSTAATFTVTVTAVDPAGASNLASTTATISIPNTGNSAPTVSVTVPSAGLVLQNMILRGTASDPDNDPLSYSWNFGDGASTAFGPVASVIHEYTQAGTYTAVLTVSDGQGHTVSASGTITITLPARPVAFPQSLSILKKYANSATYLYWIAFELDGAGVPPLRVNIVTYPAHAVPGTETLGVTAGAYYQWWNPITNTRRPECFTTASVPISCKATVSSTTNTTTGELIMTPSTAPPTVSYLPEPCWNWSGLSDGFTFTVTDGNGVTSDPAVVAFTMNAGICHPST
ncbi:MAG: PKD domain-containing protein [Nitrospirota bacterium]